MRLDHLSYAAAPQHLADTVQRLGAALGAGFVDGGLHPRFGTRNFILPLAGGTYIEVVAALDHPAAESAPFGRAVQSRAAEGGGWMGWVVAVSDMKSAERRLGRPAAQGHRIRPDGYELNWRQLGVLDTMVNPALPYFVAWDCDRAHHPSSGGGEVAIERIELVGSPAAICEWLGEPANHPLDEVEVEWIVPSSEPDDGPAPGVQAVVFQTAHGLVRID
ncbi:MAG: VOC family protein [Candidatus Nanopelagicales bacterium]